MGVLPSLSCTPSLMCVVAVLVVGGPVLVVGGPILVAVRVVGGSPVGAG